MSRGQLTAVIAALALGLTAPRLAAQDTSSTDRARPDTSGYSGAAGVDTSARPGHIGALDSTADSVRMPGDSMGVPGASASDTSGMPGRRADSITPDSGTSVRGRGTSDSTSVAEPTKQAEQGTSRTGDSTGTGSP